MSSNCGVVEYLATNNLVHALRVKTADFVSQMVPADRVAGLGGLTV